MIYLKCPTKQKTFVYIFNLMKQSLSMKIKCDNSIFKNVYILRVYNIECIDHQFSTQIRMKNATSRWIMFEIRLASSHFIQMSINYLSGSQGFSLAPTAKRTGIIIYLSTFNNIKLINEFLRSEKIFFTKNCRSISSSESNHCICIMCDVFHSSK